MHAFDLSKIVISPDIHGKVGVWSTAGPFPDPVPLNEADLIKLVWQLAEATGEVRIFATNEQCRAWLAPGDHAADMLGGRREES